MKSILGLNGAWFFLGMSDASKRRCQRATHDMDFDAMEQQQINVDQQNDPSHALLLEAQQARESAIYI